MQILINLSFAYFSMKITECKNQAF